MQAIEILVLLVIVLGAGVGIWLYQTGHFVRRKQRRELEAKRSQKYAARRTGDVASAAHTKDVMRWLSRNKDVKNETGAVSGSDNRSQTSTGP